MGEGLKNQIATTRVLTDRQEAFFLRISMIYPNTQIPNKLQNHAARVGLPGRGVEGFGLIRESFRFGYQVVDFLASIEDLLDVVVHDDLRLV